LYKIPLALLFEDYLKQTIMKNLLTAFILAMAFISCNDAGQSSDADHREDSVTVPQDMPGDTRGEKGTGTDNTGGTPGPNTITDTFRGKTDTSDHTSDKPRN
jgi:hypothetical protein